MARGLGASAVARAAGLLGANALLGEPLDREAILALGTELEGHADNMAAVLFGGLQVVVLDGDAVVHAGLAAPAGLKAVLFVPDVEMPTDESRRALPKELSREDAVYNIGRAALLVAALADGRLELLDVATRDRLHQPARAKIFPAMEPVFQAARQAGALAVFLSGGGSTILALASRDEERNRTGHGRGGGEGGRGRRDDHHQAQRPGGAGSPGGLRGIHMALIVQKYGGTSVGDADKIKNVARRIAARREKGDDLVVVVSAMGHTTDDLIALAHQINPHPEDRELDVLLSTGETVSSTLMAMALHEMGLPAISLSGAQAGIGTESRFGRARILEVDPQRIHRELGEGKIVIVAGFQGITEEMDITTLGRGGSDTTAVALAAALKAERCEIYTDVDGVYTTDPRIEPKARKLEEINYEEMLELATWGARVMHNRAVELGAVYNVPILVASSFRDVPGTLIHRGEEMVEQRNKVSGIAYDTDVAKVTVRGVPDRPGIAATLFGPLSDAGISVDTIVQNASVERIADVTFTVSRKDLEQALKLMEPIAHQISAGDVITDDHLAKVSIVGAGMTSAPGYASRMFKTLFDAGINIEMITTSEIRITCIIDESRVADAVRALHKAFELEEAE